MNRESRRDVLERAMLGIDAPGALRLFHLFATRKKQSSTSKAFSKTHKKHEFPMNRGTLLTVLGTALSVGALAAWAFVAPAAGSGWILFVAFIGALNLLNSINNGTLATVSDSAGRRLGWLPGHHLGDRRAQCAELLGQPQHVNRVALTEGR
jgi:hypothetical protein